jgi:outer membrane receptor protein involved in Fe transport
MHSNHSTQPTKAFVLIGLLLAILSPWCKAQLPRQTVKGVVVDAASGIPMPYVNIGILGTDPMLGATTADDGTFRIEQVPVGRYTVRASFIGYETALVREVEVGSGKEAVLRIALREMAIELQGVEVMAHTDKAVPDNPMAAVSGRMLGVEEASRYAGGFDDPARLASAFAGVAGSTGSNGIAVRGNAPGGMLWRLEGVEIPNPSHFADLRSFGAGGLTALSGQVLANSDFFTGAFPAEYGNALSGVFDLRLRVGNPDAREHTLRMGLMGLELASEGPFRREGRSSYLFNYRYSTLALLAPLLPDDAQGTRYHDLSFKLHFPSRQGSFSVWGLGAANASGQDALLVPERWQYRKDRETADSRQRLGAWGLSHVQFLGTRTHWEHTIAATGSGMAHRTGEIDTLLREHPTGKISDSQWKYTCSSTLHHKWSAKHASVVGILANQWHFRQDFQQGSIGQPLERVAQGQGSAWMLQAFAQSLWTPNHRWRLTAGLHALRFTLNGQTLLEPRAGISWAASEKHRLSVGYGLHSRAERLPIYWAGSDAGGRPNQRLPFARAHHGVVGWEWRPSGHLRMKVEPYVQWLFRLPVEEGTSFALLNMDQNWFFRTPLASTGTARNAGIDLTVEQFLHRGMYFLATLSAFQSRYRGGDGAWRPTKFDKGFVVNLLAGKEWAAGKANTISLSGRMTWQGGNRHTPPDEAASLLAGEVVYDEAQAYAKRLPSDWLLSLTANYRRNKAKHASVWSLQLLNALLSPEFYGYRYHEGQRRVVPDREILAIPNLSYKIEF